MALGLDLAIVVLGVKGSMSFAKRGGDVAGAPHFKPMLKQVQTFFCGAVGDQPVELFGSTLWVSVDEAVQIANAGFEPGLKKGGQPL